MPVMAAYSRNSLAPLMGAQFSTAAQGSAVQAGKQLTAAISNVSTKVNLDVSQKVDPAKPGAQCLANNLKGGAVAAQQELRGQINAAFKDIAAAQAEITAAVKAAGMDVGEVFPAKSFDTDSVMGEAFSAALESQMGAGTLATFNQALSSFTKVQDIAHDRNSGGTESVMAEIRDVLVQASQGPVQTQGGGFGHIRDVNETPNMSSTATNWQAVFEDSTPQETMAIMKAIMDFDPNKPNAAYFGDLTKMVEADGQATDYIKYLENQIEKANGLGTPYYSSCEASYLVQLDTGFAALYGSAQGNFSVLTPDEVATIAQASATESTDKPPVYDLEEQRMEAGAVAANWATSPNPQALSA